MEVRQTMTKNQRAMRAVGNGANPGQLQGLASKIRVRLATRPDYYSHLTELNRSRRQRKAEEAAPTK